VNFGPFDLYLGASLTYLIFYRQVDVLADGVLASKHSFLRVETGRVHRFDLLVRQTQLDVPADVVFAGRNFAHIYVLIRLSWDGVPRGARRHVFHISRGGI